VEPYFPRGEVTELVGAHGLFKSTLALGACLSVSSGRSWGGATVAQGKTVFVTMEDAERTLSRRVKAWLDGLPPGRERSDAEADIREHFSYLGREGARELALTSSDRHSTAIRGSVVECVTELVRGATLVVLETASRLHEGPEQNEALAVFAQAVERIATESGAAVVVVRHVSKQAAREQIVDSYAGRGGGSLSDAARSVLVVTLDRRPGEDEDDGTVPTPVRVTHAKSTLSARGAPLLWLPVVAEHGVYLRSLSAADETRADAQRLHVALLEAAGEGLTRRALRNEKPAGLGSVKAERAMAHLVQTGRAISTTENRPRNPGVVVYRAAQAVREEP
jgi:RecA/RadA recombinase